MAEEELSLQVHTSYYQLHSNALMGMLRRWRGVVSHFWLFIELVNLSIKMLMCLFKWWEVKFQISEEKIKVLDLLSK
jgi:hypothetical protein